MDSDSQDIYKELLFGLNKVNNQTKKQAQQIKDKYNAQLSGNTIKKIKSQSFLTLFQTRKDMMRLAFLPFLTLREILGLSCLSKSMNALVDPNRGLPLAEIKRTMHLKMIAAWHLLPHSDKMSEKQIDSWFVHDIQTLSDFKYLDGGVFKDQFTLFMSTQPDLSNFLFDYPQNSEHQNNTNNYRI